MCRHVDSSMSSSASVIVVPKVMEKLSLNNDAITSFPSLLCQLLEQQQHSQKQKRRQQQQKVRKNFAVTFSEVLNVCSIPSSLDQLDSIQDVKSLLWYSQNDIILMKEEIKRQCEQMKHLIQKSQPSKVLLLSLLLPSMESTKLLSSKLTLAYDSSTRGLEYKICYERNRRRYYTTRLIVQMSSAIKKKQQQQQQQGQHITKDDDNILLANASIKCTKYATHLAIEEALRDYQRTYNVYMENSDNDEELNVYYKNDDPLCIQSVHVNNNITNQEILYDCNNKKRINDEKMIVLNHSSNISMDVRNVRSRLL